MINFYSNFLSSAALFGSGCLITIIVSIISKRIFEKITQRTKNKLDDYIAKAFIDIIKPIGYLLSASISINILEIDQSIEAILIGIIKFIGLILIIRFSNKVSQRVINEWSEKVNDKSISTMLFSISPMVRAIVWCIGIILFLQNIGVQMTAIWALLSAGGIGAGLALKEPVQEFFEYITILLDKPFQNEEFIHIDGILARVERVGVRSTRLRSINGEIIVMSNSRLTSGVISNYAEMKQRRIVNKIGVIYETNYEKVKLIPDLLKNIVDDTDNVTFDRCHFINFGDFSLDFELVYYISGNNYKEAMNAKQEINLLIIKAFNDKKIEFAYPTQLVKLNNEEITDTI